jgi:hypothetical protein
MADRSDDPNIGTRAVWLAQVSAAASRLAATQIPEQLSGSTRLSKISIGSISLDPARDRLLDSDIPLAPLSRLQTRSGLVLVGLVGFILAFGLITIIAITNFQRADSWSQPAIDRTIALAASSEPLVSTTRPIRVEPTIPRLVVHSSRGMSGEPAPLGLALQGRAEGAVVIITGLVPGMELSTGDAVGGDAWQVSATHLGYAWIAPPEGFVGSATLVAELRLRNDEIADRQALHLEWITPISPVPADREVVAQFQLDREEIAQLRLDLEEIAQFEPDRKEIAQFQLDPREITTVPPISPKVVQPPLDLEEIAAAPLIPPEAAPRQLSRKEMTRLLKLGKKNLWIARRSAENGSRRAPFAAVYAGDNADAPKGFWDWSR